MSSLTWSFFWVFFWKITVLNCLWYDWKWFIPLLTASSYGKNEAFDSLPPIENRLETLAYYGTNFTRDIFKIWWRRISLLLFILSSIFYAIFLLGIFPWSLERMFWKVFMRLKVRIFLVIGISSVVIDATLQIFKAVMR